jgi:hypothetical protein
LTVITHSTFISLILVISASAWHISLSELELWLLQSGAPPPPKNPKWLPVISHRKWILDFGIWEFPILHQCNSTSYLILSLSCVGKDIETSQREYTSPRGDIQEDGKLQVFLNSVTLIWSDGLWELGLFMSYWWFPVPQSCLQVKALALLKLLPMGQKLCLVSSIHSGKNEKRIHIHSFFYCTHIYLVKTDSRKKIDKIPAIMELRFKCMWVHTLMGDM